MVTEQEIFDKLSIPTIILLLLCFGIVHSLYIHDTEGSILFTIGALIMLSAEVIVAFTIICSEAKIYG